MKTMSTESEMWDRFFRGSKYEAKYEWHKRQARTPAKRAAPSNPTEPRNYIAHGDRPQALDDRVFE